MRDIFREPLTREELTQLARLVPAAELFSWRSPRAKLYRDRKDELSDDELIDLMAEEPYLVRRPILVEGDRLLVGFQPDEYEESLGRRRT